MIQAGEKYALIAFRTPSDLPSNPLEIVPGLWIARSPIIPIGSHWKKWLGSIRVEQIERCNVFLLVKAPSTNLGVLDGENVELQNRIWKYYVGLLLSERFVTDGKPLIATGAHQGFEPEVRQIVDLDRPSHPPADFSRKMTIHVAQTGATIGNAIQQFFASLPPDGAWRLNRVLSLYTRARSLTETVDYIHQYTRCLEGLTVPPIRGTRKIFAARATLFAGATHQDLFENLYEIRGKIEHLHEYLYLEVFDRSRRIDLLKKAGIAEYAARSCLARIFDRPALWPHFRTTATIEAFWALPPADRAHLWGPKFDPQGGMAGFDETFIRDREDLGGPSLGYRT
jgi:hypothetical protein